ncbi:MAG: TolC family protein [Desulfocapsa sp.]|nr:TolC family protein [Desulfocapsa sp.]
MKKNYRRAYISQAIFFSSLLFSVHGCSNQVASHDEAVTSIKSAVLEERAPQYFAAMAESGPVDDAWLRSFNDPVLDTLIDEVLTSNSGLKIADAQVDRANGVTRQTEVDLKPTVALGAGYQDAEYRGTGSNGGDDAVGLGVSWEVDVWGRVRSGIDGGQEKAAATVADFQFARQSLAAATANGWFMVTISKLLHKFAEEVVALQEKGLEVTEAKYSIGQCTEQDAHLARVAVASAREASQKALTAHGNSLWNLELLLGQYPSADIEAADKLVAVPPPIPASIHSDILERRPDLVAAEDQVAAAFFKQKDAKLLHLPRFTFSFGIGINSLNDAIAGLASGNFAPLFTGSEIEGQIEVATAEQKEAIAAYAQTALNAFEEVERRLAVEEYLLRREDYLGTEVLENLLAYEQTKQQYEIGQIGLLDLLTMQNKWIASQIAELDIAGKRLINRVNLHLALGGSFEEAAASTL